ncbi:MAG: hypothetical protein RLZ14_422, partial [Actinomycetota bacterium]
PRLGDRLAPPPPAPRQLIPLSVNRSPYFCSGCPHNTSTHVPDGALIGGGIGCHSMVMLMEPERVGNIVGLTSMGNEGAQWFGMAPFVDDEHLIQNLGDGTLFHSGMTAVRAAIANGANITYKILYNGAVAMTGGQDPFGQLEVLPLVKVLLAEGVRQVIITTDDLSKYRAHDVPTGVKVWGRSRLIEAQEVLAAVPGCTVLIHDQRCAAEKRRDRKRDRMATPNFRVVINERVCEGCGDCGDKSNCLSVQPVDTPFGRKTRIDQASCNFDLSCMEGDCPSFMKVPVSAPRVTGTERPVPPAELPAPAATAVDECTIRLSGIGGTGVVTTAQILGTAAMLQGLHVRGLDQTGLSQKAGPVVSDLRLSKHEPHPSNRATAASVDVLLAFDQLVAGADATIRTLDRGRTALVANTATVPTGSMVVHPTKRYPTAELTERLDGSTQSHVRVDATRLATALLGDESTVNVFVAGVAVQQGLVPIDPLLVEKAIELNGVAVAKNVAAFRWGRAWAADAAAVERAAGIGHDGHDRPGEADEPLIERLSNDLKGYQSARYSRRFMTVVEQVTAADNPALTDAVARNLHKLMAYKDEYEVARLLLATAPKKARFMLHPPLLRSMGMKNKIELGSWSKPLFVLLRAMRRLRGTPLDVFGWARVRRLERTMVGEYIAAVNTLLAHLGSNNVDEAIAIASLPDSVRGYEHLKVERAAAYRLELATRLKAFTGA